MIGYDDGTFRPENLLTRAEAVTTLVPLLETKGSMIESSFSDTDMWAKDNIDCMVSLGLVEGYRDNTFRPDNAITRGEFATLLTRILALDTDDKNSAFFTDINDHWAEGAIIAIQ